MSSHPSRKTTKPPGRFYYSNSPPPSTRTKPHGHTSVSQAPSVTSRIERYQATYGPVQPRVDNPEPRRQRMSTQTITQPPIIEELPPEHVPLPNNPDDSDPDDGSDHDDHTPRGNSPFGGPSRNPPGPPGGGPPDDGGDPGNGNGSDGRRPRDGIGRRELAEIMGEALATRGSGRRKKDIKVREPETFDGSDPTKLRDFLFQCQLHFRAKRETYGTDEAKIYFTVSYLRGPTLGHFQPAIMGDLDDADGEAPDYVLIWTKFKEELYNNFGLTFPEEEAKEALKNLDMELKW